MGEASGVCLIDCSSGLVLWPHSHYSQKHKSTRPTPRLSHLSGPFDFRGPGGLGAWRAAEISPARTGPFAPVALGSWAWLVGLACGLGLWSSSGAWALELRNFTGTGGIPAVLYLISERNPLPSLSPCRRRRGVRGRFDAAASWAKFGLKSSGCRRLHLKKKEGRKEGWLVMDVPDSNSRFLNRLN